MKRATSRHNIADQHLASPPKRNRHAEERCSNGSGMLVPAAVLADVERVQVLPWIRRAAALFRKVGSGYLNDANRGPRPSG
jgi:hypothetical protein